MTTETREFIDHIDANTVHTAEAAGSFVALPDGHEIHSLEALQPRPNRMRASRTFRDTDSLAAYLERFERPESIAFSDPENAKIRVVIDHHQHEADQPAFGDHVASFSAQFDNHYAKWRELSGRPMSQVAAGLFLEERAIDVLEPDAASIMDMVMSFEALKTVTFKQSSRLHDGQRQLTYNEDNEVRGNVTLPERMFLRVPVFEGQEPDRIEIRVRYRIDDGKLIFTFEIHDQDDVERIAFERCEDALQTARPDLLLLRVV